MCIEPYIFIIFAASNHGCMSIKRNKGGRPHTGRDNRMNIVLSDEAKTLLAAQPNKSAFIDALVRGEATQIKCPHCGKVFTIKTED